MQLSALIAAVRDEVQDPGALRWSDATITRYLNDAQMDLAKDSKQLTIWTASVASGATTIAAPSDMLLPRYLWFEVGNSRVPIALRYGFPPEPATVTGDPIAMFVVGTYFYPYPVPGRAGTLYVGGVARPTTLSLSTDVPSIADADNLLIDYAVLECLLSDGDPLAGPKQQRYDRKRMEWLMLEAQKNPFPDQVDVRWEN